MEQQSLLASIEIVTVWICNTWAYRKRLLITQTYSLSLCFIDSFSHIRQSHPLLPPFYWSRCLVRPVFHQPYFSWLFSECYSIALYHASLIQKHTYFTFDISEIKITPVVDISIYLSDYFIFPNTVIKWITSVEVNDLK